MAWVRAPMSEMRLILLRCSAWLAFSLARSISCFLSPREATRMVTAPPRRLVSQPSSSSRRAGSTGTMISRGTGARATASVAVMVCVEPMASRLVEMVAADWG